MTPGYRRDRYYSLGCAFDRAEVRPEFRGVGTPRTFADEEFRIRQMGQPLGGAP